MSKSTLINYFKTRNNVGSALYFNLNSLITNPCNEIGLGPLQECVLDIADDSADATKDFSWED